jgi:hypothetical protein
VLARLIGNSLSPAALACAILLRVQCDIYRKQVENPLIWIAILA